MCDRNGLPLHVLVSWANTHDSHLLIPLCETNPAVRRGPGRRGRPRRRPNKLHADKGYVDPRYLHQRGIKPRIARRGIEDETRLGRHRGASNEPCPGCCGSNASGCATTDSISVGQHLTWQVLGLTVNAETVLSTLAAIVPLARGYFYLEPQGRELLLKAQAIAWMPEQFARLTRTGQI